MNVRAYVFAVRALSWALAARRTLAAWRRRALAIPDPELRRQAVASIDLKAFHCEGGAVYALAAPGRARPSLLRLIVALQTISDYLDNLCDRSPGGGSEDFRRLHEAFLAAVDLQRNPATPFYAFHPRRDDGGYLGSLVRACRREIGALPSYGRVRREVHLLASRYAELQVRKHLEPAVRVAQVADWAAGLAPQAGLAWWEVAAAAGSTLGLFALFAAAARPRLDPGVPPRLLRGYFPHIAALHILLDYFIDRDEDRAGGDMNFVAFYPTPGRAVSGLMRAVARAREAAAELPDPGFHLLVVAGLPALYLTDPKVAAQGLTPAAEHILRAAGPEATVFRRLLAYHTARHRGKMG